MDPERPPPGSGYRAPAHARSFRPPGHAGDGDGVNQRLDSRFHVEGSKAADVLSGSPTKTGQGNVEPRWSAQDHSIPLAAPSSATLDA